mgnify:CR=1 FL=1
MLAIFAASCLRVKFDNLLIIQAAHQYQGIMAPTHSKLNPEDGDKKMPALAKKRLPLIECVMNKVARGAMDKVAQGVAVFADEYVEAMAAGKNVNLPKSLDDVVVDVDSEDEVSEEGIN